MTTVSIEQVAVVLLVFLFLFGLFALGIVCMFNPDWGMKHFGGLQFRAGGQMRQEMNRLQFRLLGAVVAAAALYILYHLVHH